MKPVIKLTVKSNINKGKYTAKLKEVPPHMTWDRALNKKEWVDVYTVSQLHEQIEQYNQERASIIETNTREAQKKLKEFRNGMVKDVIRILKLDDKQSQKVASRVYNQNQGKSLAEIADALEEELHYLYKVLS